MIKDIYLTKTEFKEKYFPILKDSKFINIKNNANKLEELMELFIDVILDEKLALPIMSNKNVIFICMMKAAINIKSIILLLKNGYVGSARGMLRQIYEFILIAKLSLDIPDNEIVDVFFKIRNESNRISRKIDVVDYIKRNVDKFSISNSVENEDFIDFAKSVYSDYCAYTHATNESQQLICGALEIDVFIDTQNALGDLTLALMQLGILHVKEIIDGICGDVDIIYLRILDNLREIFQCTNDLMNKININKTGKPYLQAIIENKWLKKLQGKKNMRDG